MHILFVASILLGAQQTPIDTGMSWVRHAWTQVQREGRPAAEQVIRQFPGRFKAIPSEVAKMQREALKRYSSMHLDEKKALLEELWRVRHCVNLMSLIDSGMLERLTGIDSKTLKAASVQVSQLETALNPKG
jgi:hypothetical protein